MKEPNKIRCVWARTNELFISYHDEEWCIPVHDDRLLFEMINLEGAQAGLSWLTILKRRQTYKKAFENFDAKKIAEYDSVKEAALLLDAGIIRNRLKIHAVVENAKAYLHIIKEFGSFDKYIWEFVGGTPLQNATQEHGIEKSEKMSKELKEREFRFVGPTICYAFMQAVGLINDHQKDCFRYIEIKKMLP